MDVNQSFMMTDKSYEYTDKQLEDMIFDLAGQEADEIGHDGGTCSFADHLESHCNINRDFEYATQQDAELEGFAESLDNGSIEVYMVEDYGWCVMAVCDDELEDDKDE